MLFIRAHFYVLLVFIAMCSVFWLFWLSCHILANWLARKTPLRKPNRGEGIISIKPRPKSAHDFLGLLYCFIVLLCICVVSCPYVIYYPTVIARYSLFVLKVPLNQVIFSWNFCPHRVRQNYCTVFGLPSRRREKLRSPDCLSSSLCTEQQNNKKALRETQTLRAGCSKAGPKFFAPPQTPLPGAQDSPNLIM